MNFKYIYFKFYDKVMFVPLQYLSFTNQFCCDIAQKILYYTKSQSLLCHRLYLRTFLFGFYHND